VAKAARDSRASRLSRVQRLKSERMFFIRAGSGQATKENGFIE